MAYLKVLLFSLAVLHSVWGGWPTTRTPKPTPAPSVNEDSAKLFWNLEPKPQNAVVVVANATADDDGQRGSKKYGLDSLTADTDKTQTFVNQYHVIEPSHEDIPIRHTADPHTADFFKPFNKLPLLPEKKPTTLTTTILQKETCYHTIHPSCLILQNVQSVCDGVLETVLPTTTKPIADIWHEKETTSVKPSVEVEEDTDERSIKPSSAISMVATSSAIPSSPNHNDAADHLVLSSEWHLEDAAKSQALVDSARATPALAVPDASVRNETDRKATRTLPFKEPKVHLATEYLTVVTTETRVDTGSTATVVAQNCLPPDLHLPLCSGYPFAGLPFVPVPLLVSPLLTYHREPLRPLTEDLSPATRVRAQVADELKARLRDAVADNRREMTGDSGHTAQLYWEIERPQDGSVDSSYFAENRVFRSVANDSHPNSHPSTD